MERSSKTANSLRLALAVAAIWVIVPSVTWAQQYCVITGGTNNGTIIQNCYFGPARLTFQTDIAEELVRRLAPGKTIQLRSVGGNADQAVANQYQQYLQDHGFQVQRGIIGMLVPPPDTPITIGPDGTSVVIAPSAR